MGKKRVTYDLNDEHNKPPNHNIFNDHHHHHHQHHRHQNRQKSKKIKPEAKLLHTLNSHLKKISKSRSRKTISLATPPKKDLHENNNIQNHAHLSSWLIKHDDIHQHYDNWFMGFEFEHDHAYFDNGGEMGVFEFEQELLRWKNMTFIGSESNEDHFGWDYVFGPDLNAMHNLVFVFGEDGFLYGSLPDPVMNFEGLYICDVLELSSQQDMINEFIKVNLFVY